MRSADKTTLEKYACRSCSPKPEHTITDRAAAAAKQKCALDGCSNTQIVEIDFRINGCSRAAEQHRKICGMRLARRARLNYTVVAA